MPAPPGPQNQNMAPKMEEKTPEGELDLNLEVKSDGEEAKDAPESSEEEEEPPAPKKIYPVLDPDEIGRVFSQQMN